MPYRTPKSKPRESLDEYHYLLSEMMDFCHAKGLTFREGMSAAVLEWMQRNGYNNLQQGGCKDATGGLGLGVGGSGSREQAPSGVQPCKKSKSKSATSSRSSHKA